MNSTPQKVPVAQQPEPTQHAPQQSPQQTPQQEDPVAGAAAPAKSRTVRGFGRRVLLDTLYCVTAMPLTLAAFTLTWVGLTLGVPLVIIWIGLPVLYLTVVLSSVLAQAERWRLRAWLGRPAAGPGYLRPVKGTSWFARLLLPLRDPQKWLDVLWGAVAIVPGLLAFTVAAVLWTEGVAGLLSPFVGKFVEWELTSAPIVADWLGLSGDASVTGLAVVMGLVAFAVLPWAVRAVAWLHGEFSDLLLNSRSDLSERARRADGARAAAQQAEAASLRRLERDIHDGPQQRLVRLTMDLGRAKRQIATDPELATATVEDALRQARETLEELRALSRGIAPPLLVDRGLGVALDELVVRSAVPVDLLHELPPGLSPHVETTVYFTVSEALTNVAKHSGAASARARVVGQANTLLIEVSDDGVGGAHLSKGHGLAGLEQRLTAVGGTLSVDSPAGGPTLLMARIPLS